ncbi:hypothetical protein G7Y89_g10242 [Cudoniella acicularis]|uniref:2EXR domain-containing protein n=1 Tax=Cudoniella acicularis TaxID=354080 RepID=A0A8H4RFW5_9HELO|nr:hypothetical protein G7Y89_g10242 [Cudoniella acicularis]
MDTNLESMLLDENPWADDAIAKGETPKSTANAGITFPRFAEFPLEIRRLIWKAALPDARIALLEYKSLDHYTCYRVRSDRSVGDLNHWGIPSFFECLEIDQETHCDSINELVGFRSRCTPPAILFVCRESFEVASKFYSRAFGSLGSFPEVWFNFESDYLYLDWGESSGMSYSPEDIPTEEAHKVRNLVLFKDDPRLACQGFRSTEAWLAYVLLYFPNVETVIISRMNGTHTSEESVELVFKDPIPIEVTTCYELVGGFSDEKDPFKMALRGYQIEGMEWVNENNLQHRRKQLLGDESILPPPPAIVCKIITTPACKARLIRAEKKAQNALATNKTRSFSVRLKLPE